MVKKIDTKIDTEMPSGILGLGLIPMKGVGTGVLNRLQTEGRVLNMPNVNALKNSFITGFGFYGGARVVDRIYDALMRLRI